MIKKCLRCKGDFYTKPSRIKEGKGKYCSLKCYWGERIEKECLNCGKKFNVPPCLNRVNTCSVSCGATLSARRGEQHHNWKGGVTDANKLDRVRFQHTIQKKVFERDDYSCVMCGDRENLQVDHIQPWSEYVELRFDMNNCRTLCMNCHYKITFKREAPDDLKSWGQNLSQIERGRGV